MSGGPADLPALMEEVRNMADRAGEDGDDSSQQRKDGIFVQAHFW